jgi:hypothetical protein
MITCLHKKAEVNGASIREDSRIWAEVDASEMHILQVFLALVERFRQ